MISLPVLVPDVPDLEVLRVQGKTKERWIQLCGQAAIEQDSQKLMKLIQEISQLLDEKEEQLKQQAETLG